ncbi:MAG: hypothetical protein ABEN55_21105 [Bradymonadaceae bacterium]
MTGKRINETWSDYQDRIRCDNAGQYGNNISDEIPGCWDGTKQVVVEVVYNELESNRLELCKACTEAILEDAEKHRFDVNIIERKED